MESPRNATRLAFHWLLISGFLADSGASAAAMAAGSSESAMAAAAAADLNFFAENISDIYAPAGSSSIFFAKVSPAGAFGWRVRAISGGLAGKFQLTTPADCRFCVDKDWRGERFGFNPAFLRCRKPSLFVAWRGEGVNLPLFKNNKINI